MNNRSIHSFFLLTSFCLITLIIFICINDTNVMKLVKYNLQEATVGDETVIIPIEQILRSPVVLEEDNRKLINYIQRNYLIPPSSDPYNLMSGDKDPSMGQSSKIREIFKNKRNGFFVECGALDGETRSNTLMFEKDMNWEGILIEGDPKNAEMIQYKHRNAYVVPACLSIVTYPKAMMFAQRFNQGKIVDVYVGNNTQNSIEVQCFPLYSILLAVGVTNVDYFSLDIEGNELQVLKTIPWDKVNITALSVEYIHTIGGKEALREYMEGMGYIMYSTVVDAGQLANDYIFYHPKLLGDEL